MNRNREEKQKLLYSRLFFFLFLVLYVEHIHSPMYFILRDLALFWRGTCVCVVFNYGCVSSHSLPKDQYDARKMLINPPKIEGSPHKQKRVSHSL